MPAGEIGARLRELRARRALTLAEADLASGVTPKRLISRIENGDINFRVAELVALAKAYGVSVSDIIPDSGVELAPEPTDPGKLYLLEAYNMRDFETMAQAAGLVIQQWANEDAAEGQAAIERLAELEASK